MNPALLLQLLSLVQAAISSAPSLVAEFNAIKAAGTATPAQLTDIQAQIATMEAARLTSWAAADTALDAAAKT